MQKSAFFRLQQHVWRVYYQRRVEYIISTRTRKTIAYKAHWLGAVFPRFRSPENIMTWLYDFRGLFGLYETEAGDEGWVLSEALCTEAGSHLTKQAILARR
jgi:hypothetical protein